MTRTIAATRTSADVEAWREQLRRGGLELAILLALADGARYGLDIIRHLGGSIDLVVTDGTIYPILARLSRDGMVESEWRDEASHPRKYYRLTKPGRARMTDMVEMWEDFGGKLARLIAAARKGRHEAE